MTEDIQPGSDAGRAASTYWRRTRQLTLWLLALWFVVTVLATAFAREIDALLPGWPLGFWFGAQGALLLFLLIVAVYIVAMEKLEALQAKPADSGTQSGG